MRRHLEFNILKTLIFHAYCGKNNDDLDGPNETATIVKPAFSVSHNTIIYTVNNI